MAKTMVVNPRRRRRAAKRRRNPSSAVVNPRRRRRRYYGAAKRRRSNPTRRRSSSRRRRRNPGIASGSFGYRKSNPDVFDLDALMAIAPAATMGIWAVRYAMNMAGPFEIKTTTNAQGATVQVAEPGIKHAIAGLIGAKFGSGLVAQMLGDNSKETIALYSGIGFVGDVFLRKRFLADNKFVSENLMLAGVDDCDGLSGLQEGSQLGDDGVQYVQDADGNVYQIEAGDDGMSGLQEASQLGAANMPRGGSSSGSTFGY